MNRFRHSKKSFTLAEILIVIGIIAFVAILTIPLLSVKIRNNQLKQQFAKKYSEISQALIDTKIELNTENLVKSYVYWDGTQYVNSAEFINSFYKQLKISGTKNYTSAPMNFTDNAVANWSSVGDVSPNNMLPDGSTVDCMINAGLINITIDTNGPLKSPNKVGYDIFNFYVDSRDTIQPKKSAAGTYISWPEIIGTPCSQASTQAGNGMGCTYYAMIDKNPDDSTQGYWDSLK